MITTRLSGAQERNRSVVALADKAAATNRDFYRQQAQPGSILLVGGSNTLHFRIRVAQSHLRSDLLPSFWSGAGIVVSPDTFLSVPMGAPLDPDTVPERNGIQECAIDAFDDARFPNIAILSFAANAAEVVDNANRLRYQRGAVDLPHLLVQWLAFVWGVGTAGNPLLQNIGIPSSALVETAFGMAGVELTPGIASASSCPEAIWQSAIWWHNYYEQTAGASVGGERRKGRATDALTSKVPEGSYIVRQPAAAVVEQPQPAPTQAAAVEPRRTKRPPRKSSTSRTRRK